MTESNYGLAKAHRIICHCLCFAANRLRYDISYSDYFELSFYKKSAKEKAEYITAREQTKIAHAVDRTALGRYFTRKESLYRLFRQQMNREQLPTGCMTFDEFSAFVQRHERFLYKPDAKWSGVGVRMIDTVTSEKPIYELYLELIRERGILDELIVQHHQMNELNPSSLNTIRVVSFFVNGEVELLGAAVRIGRKGNIVDNYDANGIACSVDLYTGKILCPGEDKFAKRYETHPDSGVKLIGFQVPNWDKVISLVHEAARISPVHYVGWDIAVRENDCILVEGNYDPHLNSIQIAGGGGKRAICERLAASYTKSV